MQPRAFAVVYLFMKLRRPLVCLCFVASSAVAQIQVELKFPRLQYIAYEPVVANLVITNLAGPDVDLRDNSGQSWFGFDVNENEDRPNHPDYHGWQKPPSICADKSDNYKNHLST